MKFTRKISLPISLLVHFLTSISTKTKPQIFEVPFFPPLISTYIITWLLLWSINFGDYSLRSNFSLLVWPDFRLSRCILSSRAHFISNCWLWVRFHASVLILCLSLDMLAKLFFFDKNTIIGMFIALKNKKDIMSKSLNVLSYIGRRKLCPETIMKIKTKRIQDIVVDFKGISTFSLTMLWSLQWVLQTPHISLRNWFSARYVELM